MNIFILIDVLRIKDKPIIPYTKAKWLASTKGKTLAG
jgi:hypothetical protein